MVALAKGGRRIDAKRGNDHVFGYAVGLDMTRRDLQQWGKDHGGPGTSARTSTRRAVRRAGAGGEDRPPGARRDLAHGQRQAAPARGPRRHDLVGARADRLPFRVLHARAGDLIYSGTPAGVGPVKPGDELHAGIDGVGELKVKILPPL